MLRHVAPVAFGRSVERLHVHGLPDGPGLDLGPVQIFDQSVPGTPKFTFVDEKTTQPIGMQPITCLWHKLDSRKAGQIFGVAQCNSSSLLNTFVQGAQLPAPDTSEYIAESIVVAQFAVLVSETGFAGLSRPKLCLPNQFRI